MPAGRPRRDRIAAAAVFALALAVRLTFVLDTPRGGPIYDEVLYDGLAHNILAGNGFTLDGVPVDSPAGVPSAAPPPYLTGPTANRAPGYPVLLAAVYGLFGDSLGTVFLLQAVLGAASCLLVYRLARALPPGGEGTALLAGLLAATSNTLVVWTNKLLTENLAVPLVLLVALWLLRPPATRPAWSSAAVGLALGLLVLTRPELALLAPVAVAWVALDAARNRSSAWRKRDGAWIGLVLVLSLVPWTGRNWRQLGGFVFVRSFSGMNLYIANNDNLLSLPAMAQGETSTLYAGVAALPPDDELAFDRLLAGRALAFIRTHPGRVLRAAAYKTAVFWRPLAEPWWPAPGVANSIVTGVAAWWLTLLGLLVSLSAARRFVPLYGPLAAQALVVAAFGAWERERFRAPVHAFELVLLALGVAWLVRQARALAVRGRQGGPALGRRTMVAAAAASVAGLAFAGLAARSEPVVAFNPFDQPADLAALTFLQGSAETVAIDPAVAARGLGSLRVTTDPEHGWQDLQLELAAGSYEPNAFYRVEFYARATGAGGGQVYALVPASATGGSSVGLGRQVFTDAAWQPRDFLFMTPLDARLPVAVYLSNADYSVAGSSAWIDELTVRRSSWAHFLWEACVRGGP